MKPRLILGLAGRAGAGKDTAAALLKEIVWDTYPDDSIFVTGFARRVKAGLRSIFGLDFEGMTRAEKERVIPEIGKSPRQLMQLLGTEWGREKVHEDLWVTLLSREVMSAETRFEEVVIITDLRFRNERDWIRRHGGAVWWVERDGIQAVAAHKSEESITPMDCDRTVANMGTKEDLERELRRAWEQLVAQRRAA